MPRKITTQASIYINRERITILNNAEQPGGLAGGDLLRTFPTFMVLGNFQSSQCQEPLNKQYGTGRAEEFLRPMGNQAAAL
ncbi:unnamed protein product [Fusarium graminearum]|uniref:Chromosome 1, complete genome n=2 Tax=Gibberella zeae TaxID=5518 RepID=A0A098D772_GIBZE|nr:unnamed protein product [Fusarium graminearum]CAF3592195.1 unnamed protein product [Fusarium graminearum]CAF3601833.1 unnamed protein product [Fusarium graminearum]CAG1964184.1 unnamed protein product [Fusarium graminearum]CAG1969658.1 unnamed protein product [Fusarium graminearum]